MTINVLWLGGTGWGRGGDGISETFAKHLDPKRFAFGFIEYPATYGAGQSYGDSRAAGRRALRAAIKSSPGPIVIGGYSQGAGIAGDIAADIGHSMSRVRACALIADPMRMPGAGMPGVMPASGFGISGPRAIGGVPTFWAAAEGDPITALPAGNPLRSIADFTKFMAIDDPVAAHRWGAELVKDAIHGRWQRWWSWENVRSWNGAIAYARGYVVDGRHTNDYVLHGHCQRLAECINREVS